MSGLNCNVCGGELDLQPHLSYGVCQFCGHKQPLSRSGNSELFQALNHANGLRRQCEFDEAIEAYNDLLGMDSENAEAHWGLLLSRYGVEYVKESDSEERKPTLHRLRKKSITGDPAYQNALRYAPDAESRALYEAEGKRIAQIQKGIIELIPQGIAYDVFICYKENDGNGHLTEDYSLANAIYIKLTGLGYRVFFANITLQGVLGSAYEPHIFSALNSAKVMLVIGTKPEYVNAVWVKNEWSRYLELIDQNPDDPNRHLIPCYKGMSAYQLPAAFNMLQAQNLNDLNAMENLVRRIRQLVPLKGGPDDPPNPPEGGSFDKLNNLRKLLAMGHYSDASHTADGMAGEYVDSSLFWFYRAAAKSQNFDLSHLNGDALNYLQSARTLAEENRQDKNRTVVLDACRQVDAKREAKTRIAQRESELVDTERLARQSEQAVDGAKKRIEGYEADMKRKEELNRSTREESGKLSRQIFVRRFWQLLRFALLLCFLIMVGSYLSKVYYLRYLDFIEALKPYPAIASIVTNTRNCYLKIEKTVIELKPLYNSGLTQRYFAMPTAYMLYVSIGLAVLTLLRMLNRSKKIKAFKARRRSGRDTLKNANRERDAILRHIAEERDVVNAEQGRLDKLNEQIQDIKSAIEQLRQNLSWKYTF